MFASLIRRKGPDNREVVTEAAFESTTVSLSTAVPRPAERRDEERVAPMLRIAKLTREGGDQQLIRVKNLSAGGVMAFFVFSLVLGVFVVFVLSSQIFFVLF